MSKYKVGDKVVVDITGVSKYGESYEVSHKSMWSTGSVDRVAKPLSTYIEQARAEGAEAAWELARKIVIQNGYSSHDLYEIFESNDLQLVLEEYTYPEAAAKVEAWEKAKEEIKVGDIFQDNDGNNAIVTSIKGNTVYYMWDDGDTRSGFAEDVKKHFTKTGRHIDIDSFLKQIGGEQE